MAIIFATDGIGQAITHCWLDGNDVTRLAVRVYIPAIENRTDMPPATGRLKCSGSIDLLDTDDEGHIIADTNSKPIPIRHYGMIQLEWSNA